MKKMYGVITAMVTPFGSDGNVDESILRAYTRYLVDAGVHCLYPCGTTGEMLKMSLEERKRVAEIVLDEAKDSEVAVFIHVGAMTTKDTIELARHAEAIGADGIGVVTPQFFGVNDREMEEFYVQVASSVSSDFPIYLYGIPQAASNDIKPEVVNRIVKRAKNVVGLKYSYPDFLRVKDYLLCNNGNFDVVVGTDRLFLPALAMGCVGTVSGVSNCGPKPFITVYDEYRKGDLKAARIAQTQANELCEITRSGANMAIFKRVMAYNGLPFSHMRAPALDLTDAERQALEKEIDGYNKRWNS